jgi:hypothetical protein
VVLEHPLGQSHLQTANLSAASVRNSVSMDSSSHAVHQRTSMHSSIWCWACSGYNQP